MLGTFHGATHFQLLSGFRIGRQEQPYWPIFITITCFISVASLICVSSKKIVEKYKDKIILQQINIHIHNPQIQSQYNNMKNNVSLLNGFEMTLIVGIAFIFSLLILVNIFSNQSVNQYWANAIHLELVSYIIYKVIIPIIYLAKRRDVRSFIWNNYF